VHTQTTSRAAQRRRRAARLATTGAAALAAAAFAGCGGGDDGAADVRFCAVAEGSLSTSRSDIRVAYLDAFSSDVEWFARQPGSSPMCLLLAIGNPTTNPIGELPIRATNPNSPDAEGEVVDNIELAKSQFAQVLSVAADPVGSPILEALYTLAVRGDLRAGDTISVYSDMRQDSPLVKTFTLVSRTRQAQRIELALDRLRTAGLLPDGNDGRPSLRGVNLVVPEPSASAEVSKPDNRRLESARQVVAKEFWFAWAAAVGANLKWGDPASGGRSATS
jgi:hypothetical protein